MFKMVSLSSLYWFTIAVPILSEDGSEKKWNCDGQFERFDDQEKLEHFLNKGGSSGGTPSDAEIMDRVFRGWRKIEDESGQPLAVNDENRAKLLAYPGFKPAAVRAWMLSCGVKGVQGN